nr:hypothetical protein FQY85_03780 [Cronobacter turicensis]
MTIFGSAGQFVSENILKSTIKRKKCEPGAEFYVIGSRARSYAGNRSVQFVFRMAKVHLLLSEKVNGSSTALMG